MNDANVLQSIQGHPNIVRLVDVIPEGIVNTKNAKQLHVDYAMVLESLKGGELSYNLIKYGRFTPELTQYFFLQITSAIHHMHRRGFCHRDLKPWNVMLTEDLTTAKVIDFSYSTPLKAKDIPAICPKLLGFLSGTKYYMAPE